MPINNTFNKNIFVELGLEELSDEKKIGLLEKMSDLVIKNVMTRVAEIMTEEETEELNKITEEGDGEEVQAKALAYIGEKVPNLENIFNEEIDKLKAELKVAVSAGLMDEELRKPN